MISLPATWDLADSPPVTILALKKMGGRSEDDVVGRGRMRRLREPDALCRRREGGRVRMSGALDVGWGTDYYSVPRVSISGVIYIYIYIHTQ